MRKLSLTIIMVAAFGVVSVSCASVQGAQAPPTEPAPAISAVPEEPKTMEELAEELAKSIEFLTGLLLGSERDAMDRIQIALRSGSESKLKTAIEEDLPQIQDELLVKFWSTILGIAYIYETHPSCLARQTWVRHLLEQKKLKDDTIWSLHFGDHYLLTRLRRVYSCKAGVLI